MIIEDYKTWPKEIKANIREFFELIGYASFVKDFEAEELLNVIRTEEGCREFYNECRDFIKKVEEDVENAED